MQHEPGETAWEPYGYSSDALVRRQSHELGASGFQFYQESLSRMDFKPTDVVVDIGAGLGNDGYCIARKYRPRTVFLLEPDSPNHRDDPLETFDDLFYWMEMDIQSRGTQGIKVLHSSQAEQTMRELKNPASDFLQAGTTYLQPLPSAAENNPLPPGSVDKATLIHSAYEFYDLDAALDRLRIVLAEDGLGMLITNGSNDKLVFKSILEQAGVILKNKAPATVSSRLPTSAAIDKIAEHFKIVDIMSYMDDMVITQDTLHVPINSFNSYTDRFERMIINKDRLARVRKKVLEDPMNEMIRDHGYALDSIDITAIYFRKK